MLQQVQNLSFILPYITPYNKESKTRKRYGSSIPVRNFT